MYRFEYTRSDFSDLLDKLCMNCEDDEQEEIVKSLIQSDIDLYIDIKDTIELKIKEILHKRIIEKQNIELERIKKGL